MIAPKQFIIEKEGKLELNEEVLKLIENSKNPNFLLFYGITRRGKSTTLNQIIRGNYETWKFKNKKPFYALDSIESITKGCDIFGPIKASVLIKRHLLNIELEEDFDVFFCDTEGFSSLDGILKQTISGILTLLQLCTISVSISPRVCINDDLKELCSQIQISRIIKNINNNLSSPLILVYISNILYGDGDDYNEEENENEDENYEKIKNLYEQSRQKQKNKLLIDINENKKLNIGENDIEIIPGGKYQNIRNEKEPDHNDPFVKLYWDSIKEIVIKFINAKKNNDPKQVVTWIRVLFDMFKNVESINDNFNLEKLLKNLLVNSFDEFTKKQFEIKKSKIKEDIDSNFMKYIDILKEDEKAKKSLNECLDMTYIDIYNKLIPEKVKNFIDLGVEQYRILIKEEINNKLDSLNNNILSDNNINELIKDKINIINNTVFQEDIDYNKLNIEKIWTDVYYKNKLVLDYFNETKNAAFNNLKGNFIYKINKLFNNLINQKIKWEDYLKDKKILIYNKNNEILPEYFKDCYYKEDLEIYHKQYNQYYNNIYNQLYTQLKKDNFNNIPENKLQQINDYMNKTFKEKYNEIISNNKLPIWKNIKSEIIKNIQTVFDSYISNIFLNKEFQDDININLCSQKSFLNIIPIGLIEKYQLTNEKKKEINELINSEINSYIIIFNTKLNNLPLFQNFINQLINMCNILIDEEIEKLFTKFYYAEDIIPFDTNIIFSFLIKNYDIYKGVSSRINEINLKIRELCNKKANEYLTKILINKPKWEKIKSEKIILVNNILKKFIDKIFYKACYKEDIIEIKKEDLKLLIIESENIYQNIKENKINELELEIDNIIEKNLIDINREKNTLPVWKAIKKILLQDAIIEMESALKLDITEEKNNYKSKNEFIDEFDIVVEILISYVRKKKILDQCLNKKRKNELMKKILKKAKKITENYILKEKKEKEEEQKREQERKIEEEKIKRMEIEAERQRKEREEIEKMIKIKEEEERKKIELGNWRKYVNKDVLITSIFGNRCLCFSGEQGRKNCIPIVLNYIYSRWDQKFKLILNDDGSVTFSNEGFAIDVNGGVVSNSNIIQLYERNGTNAQKFFVRHWGNGWFSLHSALNQNYCIDIRQGSSEPFTQIQLYENNGTNAQKFRFVD